MGDESWVLLVFTGVLFMIMYIWNYGSKLRYGTEVKKKLSMNLMMKLGCNLGTIRSPGIGLVYNELLKGIPTIFGHFVTTLPTIHSMIIFVCIKYVPVPVVRRDERFLFRHVCPKRIEWLELFDEFEECYMMQVGVQTSQMQMLASNNAQLMWERYDEEIALIEDNSLLTITDLLE